MCVQKKNKSKKNPTMLNKRIVLFSTKKVTEVPKNE